MGLPVVKYLKYAGAGSTSVTSLDAGSTYTTSLVTANRFSQAAAFRMKFVSDNTFDVDSAKIWANSTKATINGETEDLGLGYPTSTAFWSMVYKYQAVGAKTITAVQTSVLTCPTAIWAKGSTTWTKLPADFRGDTKASGVNLITPASSLAAKSSGGQYVVYTKPMGISFKPNASAQYGHYTNFSVRVEFTFS